MVKPIYLVSLRDHVGKSILSIGILQKLKKEGKKVAYFKPIGVPKGAFSNKADHDVGFIISTVFKTSKPYDIVSPVSIPESYYLDLVDAAKKEDYLRKIKAAYEDISEGMDYVIIEGSDNIRKFIRVGLDDLSIAQALEINDLIYIEKVSSDKCIDNIFFTKKYFDFRNVNFKGIIFNKIHFEYIPRIKELADAHINRYNIPIIGIIERRFELWSARVSEILASIGGEFINEPAASAGLDNRVENYIIGAMNVQPALKYLRQVNNAAVVTGGDRTDLAIAALETNCACLILTGFIQPDLTVITRANEKGIPIILSPSDTYTTIRNMENVKPGIQEDEVKIAMDLVEDNLDWDILLK